MTPAVNLSVPMGLPWKIGRNPKAQDEDSPEAIDHGGHRREEFNHVRERDSKPAWSEFREEDGDAQADRYAEEEGERGCHERAVDERHGTEDLRRDRIPDCSIEEAGAERPDRLVRDDEQDGDDQREQTYDRDGDSSREPSKERITQGGRRAHTAAPPRDSKEVHASFGRRTVLSYVAFAH